jgi:hypothetical protein
LDIHIDMDEFSVGKVERIEILGPIARRGTKEDLGAGGAVNEKCGLNMVTAL